MQVGPRCLGRQVSKPEVVRQVSGFLPGFYFKIPLVMDSNMKSEIGPSQSAFGHAVCHSNRRLTRVQPILHFYY